MLKLMTDHKKTTLEIRGKYGLREDHGNPTAARDSRQRAARIGFAIGAGKPILGWNVNARQSFLKRREAKQHTKGPVIDVEPINPATERENQPQNEQGDYQGCGPSPFESNDA